MKYLADGKGLGVHKRTIRAEATDLNLKEWEAVDNKLYMTKAFRSDMLPWLKTRDLLDYKDVTDDLSCGFGYNGNRFFYVESEKFHYEGIKDTHAAGKGKKYFKKHEGNGRIYMFPNGNFFSPSASTFTNHLRSAKNLYINVQAYVKNAQDLGLCKLTCESFNLASLFGVGDCARLTMVKDGTVSVHRVITRIPDENGIILEPYAFGSGVSFSANMDITNGMVESECVGCVSVDRVWFGAGTHIYATGVDDVRWEESRRWPFAYELDEDECVTACEDMNGHPVFFTERSIYTVSGSDPSNFELHRADVRGGLAAEMSHTLTYVLGCLYYQTHYGIARFDGERTEMLEGLPFDFKKASMCFGTDSRNLYVSYNPERYGSLYAYDVLMNQWMDTGIIGVSYIFSNESGAYGYTKLGRIYKFPSPMNAGGSSDYQTEISILYEARFKFNIGGDKPYRIRLDGDVDKNGSFTVRLYYDGGEEIQAGTVFGMYSSSPHQLMLVPKSCSRLVVKITGARPLCIRNLYVDVIS